MEDGVPDYTFDQYKKHHALIGKEITLGSSLNFSTSSWLPQSKVFTGIRKIIYK